MILEAPQALVAGLDFAKIKKKYNLLGASLNGPKLWMPDWSEARAGVVRDFGGIKAAWVGQLNMGDIKGGVATIMPDEFFNVYDKTGPGMSNDKP